jgi:GNAT superfamily N-acetyltransferase
VVEEEGEGAAEVQVKNGINPIHIKKLIYYSLHDLLIEKFTSDKERYKNLKAFKKGINKRNYYSLVDVNNDLAGIVWFSNKSIPDTFVNNKLSKKIYKVTVALRIYKNYRGKGLSTFFLEEAVKRYKKEFLSRKNEYKLWLLTSKDNIPAQKTYIKCGFIKASKPDLNGKILMIEK